MSAITGIFYRDGREVNHNQIKKMNDSLAHRGKDGSGVWSDGSVAVGHQMLHTTQESLHEKLPFKDESSGMVITADARIDNRAELASLLKLEDNENVPDSAFILEAYKMWGECCPEKLLGDFAFAVWDPKKEQLFCARDHMGVKPFYYYLSDETFFFATEIRALFCLHEVPREINELKVAFHLALIDDSESTFYRDILRLGAAHSLTVSSSGTKLRRYWKLDPELKIEMDSDEDYIKAFRDIFTEAVKCRLRSAFPVGSELSGGLDSSSVTCVAKKILGENSQDKLKTFSFIFKDFPDADETYYINKVVEMGGVEPHFLDADGISPLEDIEIILWHLEEPFNYPSMAVLWNLFKKKQETGVRIVLTGEDGDSVVSTGQNYLRELAVTLQWRKLFKEIKCTSDLFNLNKASYDRSESLFIKKSKKSFYSTLVTKVILPLVPDILKKALKPFYNKKNHVRMKPDLYILNRELTERLEVDKYLKEFQAGSDVKDPKELHYDLITTCLHQGILEMTDRMAAAFSVEQRHPFFDKRLVEFCYALPTKMKYQNGWSRYVLRKAMEDILPEEVCWRFFKQDYLPPLQKNLFSEKILDEVVCSKILEDYVDAEKFKEVYGSFKSQYETKGGPTSVKDVTDSVDVWLVTVLYAWCVKIRKSS